ncbi:FIG167255: hypothetical protein [invertebrate metagenome]|uniref:Cellulase-like protein n=1 Tax=invertebrate metagenome TaxID=1711999 RepID=A0A484HCX7_9ZZZZ
MNPSTALHHAQKLCCLWILPSLTILSAAAAAIANDTAVLRWLDKVVARVSTIDAPVGQTFSIAGSTLHVVVHACVTLPPTDTPESAAFVDVWEVKPDEQTVEVFRGWMFTSSPAFSAMEHPIYDVWLLACHNRDSLVSQRLRC